jgi:glycerol-3-phosphate acyltransferase PlsY
VGFLDILKGFLPAWAFGYFVGQPAGEVAGLAAVIGHITSPYLRGRGGKGVATTLGAILGVQPLLAIPVLVAFGLGVAVWHRVGLGAVLGAVALIVIGIVGWTVGWTDESDMWFAVVLGMLVLFRHQRNIRDAWGSFRA